MYELDIRIHNTVKFDLLIYIFSNNAIVASLFSPLLSVSCKFHAADSDHFVSKLVSTPHNNSGRQGQF